MPPTSCPPSSSVIRPAEDSPYGRLATVADNQGAVFSLISIPPGGE